MTRAPLHDRWRGQLIAALHDADVETGAGLICSSGDVADFLEERLPWLFAERPQLLENLTADEITPRRAKGAA